MNDVIVWRPSNSDTAQLAMEIRADIKAASAAKSTYIERMAAAGAKLIAVRERLGLEENMNTLSVPKKREQGLVWRNWLEAEGVNVHVARFCLRTSRNPEGARKKQTKDVAKKAAVVIAFRKLRPAVEELQKVLNMSDPEDALNWCIAMAKRETRYSDAA
jgi:hypothetical protein